MISHLRKLTLIALISLISITVYSQSTKSKEARETDKSKPEKIGKVLAKDKVGLPTEKTNEGKTEGNDGEYWFGRGYSLHQSDRYIEAIEAFSHSIAQRFRQATSMYNVACGYALLNDKENALFWLNRSLAAGFDRADLLRNDSDLDPLRSDPRFKEIVQKASLTKREDKPGKDKTISRLEDAILNFDRLVSESSQDGDQWYQIGSRLLRLRDLDRAAIALTRAIENLQNGASAMYNLACAYSIKGDRALGLEWLEKSINAGFDSTDKLNNDPDIANLRGEPRFKEMLELSRVLSLSQFNGAGNDSSQYSKPRWAPAVKIYETFLRDKPNNGRAWFNLGYALHFSSEHGRAIQAFEKSVQLGYRKPTCLYNIACAYSMMGNRDAAFEFLDKAVEAGFDIEGYINGDDDLDNLRSDPRFERFSKMADDEHKHKVKTDK